MWLGIGLAVGLTIALLAMCYFAVNHHDQEAFRDAPGLLAASTATGRWCGACNAPLRRVATTEQVVFEVERRIDSDLRSIARSLGAPPDRHGPFDP